MYKPKSEWKDNLSTGLGGENQSGFQNDWAMVCDPLNLNRDVIGDA